MMKRELSCRFSDKHKRLEKIRGRNKIRNETNDNEIFYSLRDGAMIHRPRVAYNYFIFSMTTALEFPKPPQSEAKPYFSLG